MPVPNPLDGITYTAQGAYADRDFAALGGVYTTPAGLGPRLGKIGLRHVAVDPAGKVMLLRGLMRCTPNDAAILQSQIPVPNQAGRSLDSNLISKYGSKLPYWRDATGARLRSMHYNIVGNTSGDFNTGGGMLVITQNAVAKDASDPSRIAQALGTGTEPIKDLTRAVNFASGCGGNFWGDTFDPKYQAFVNVWVTVWADSKIFAFWADDGDFVSAFGGFGHENEVGWTDTVSTWRGFHGGIYILCTRPIVTHQEGGYAPFYNFTVDTVNHSKQALIDFLKARYNNSITDLNAAWGTGNYYTSFDSNGGYGVGTGLNDEDGARAHAWMGSGTGTPFPQVQGPNNLVDSTRWGLAGSFTASTYYTGLQVSRMKEDLDHFFFLIWESYLKPVRDRIKGVRPNALFAGPNGGGPGGRAPQLKAANLYCDVLMGGGHYAAGGGHILNPNAVAQTNWERRYLTIPTFTSIYNGNNRDSCLYYIGGDDGTQEANGARTAQIIGAAMAYQAPNGEFPYIGYMKWGLYDQIGEGAGWGLFSLNDNPYDGRDYRPVALGGIGGVLNADPYNAITDQVRTTITEDKKYGDQITAIVTAHKTMLPTLDSQINATNPPVAEFTWVQQTNSQRIVFTETSQGIVQTRLWDFGDGQSATTANPTHLYAVAGLYTVKLTVTNAYGQSFVIHQVTVAAVVPGTLLFRNGTTRYTAGNVADLLCPVASIQVGDLVVVGVFFGAAASQAHGVADSLGNVYTTVGISFDQGVENSLWYTLATVGGEFPTIFCGLPTPATTQGWGRMIAYIASIAPPYTLTVDGLVRATGTNAVSPVSVGPLTETVNDRNVLLGMSLNFGSPDTQTPPVGWTGRAEGVVLAERAGVAAGPYSYQPTYSGVASWIALLVGFHWTTATVSDVRSGDSLPVLFGEPMPAVTMLTIMAAPVTELMAAGLEEAAVLAALALPAGAEALAVPIQEVESRDTTYAVTDVVALQGLEAPEALRIEGAMGLAIGLNEASTLQSSPAQLTAESLRVGVGERGAFDIVERWPLANDASSVNGEQPWTRLSGTHWTVANQTAKLSGPTTGVEVARCDRPSHTIDQEVTLVVPQFARNDAVRISLGPMSRQDGTGTLSYMSVRASLWGGGDTMTLYKVVAGVEQALATVTRTVAPFDAITIKSLGSSHVGLHNGVIVLGPIDDAALTGQYWGMEGLWEGGTLAEIAADMWVGQDAPSTAIPFDTRDGAVPVRLSEQTATMVLQAPQVTLRVELVEIPLDPFAFRAGGDEPMAVGLGERAVLFSDQRTVDWAEGVAVVLDEAALRVSGETYNAADTWGLGLAEVEAGGTDLIVVGAGDLLVMALDRKVGLVIPIQLVVDTIIVIAEAATVAGPTAPSSIVAGPSAEEATPSGGLGG